MTVFARLTENAERKKDILYIIYLEQNGRKNSFVGRAIPSLNFSMRYI